MNQITITPVLIFLNFQQTMAAIYDFSDNDSEVEFEGFSQEFISDDLPDSEESDFDINISSSEDSNSDSDNDSDNDVDIATEEHLPDWTDNFRDDGVYVPGFTHVMGPILPNDFNVETALPIEYFHLFVTDAIVTDFVKYTNSYSRYVQERKRTADLNYVDTQWSETDKLEMNAFLGINIFFGLNQLPTYKQYWSPDPFLGNQGLQNVMPIKRDEKLSQYFHVSDRNLERPSGHPEYDKLYKIREIHTTIAKSFETCNEVPKFG